MPYTGISTLFQQIVRNTQLSQASLDDASGKHERVRRALNKRYWSTDSGSANSMLVGSYGKNTEITPPSDIDILFELPWSVYTRFNDRTGNVQSQLLQEVKSVLLDTFPSTDVCGDGQVVSVPFSSYAVEVLPAFHSSDGEYWHANSNDGGSWRKTDPVAERSALASSNARTGGKTTHLVKLAKAWKRTRNVKIKSFVLELAAVRFLDQWAYDTANGAFTSYSWYDFMMRDFFPWLLVQRNSSWYLPGLQIYDTIAVGDAWVAQAEFAASASARATEHGQADRLESAKSEWRNVFGIYVPT